MGAMKQFSERQRIELALIWALALALLYALVLAPFFTAQREAAHAERAAAQMVHARVDVYQQLLIADARVEEKLRARQVRLADALPEERGQGSFMQDVERIARRNGVTVEGVAPQPVKTADGVLIQPIEIRLRGSYFDVLSFLHAVQEGERCVRFGDFALTTEEQTLHIRIRMEIAARAEAE